MDDPSAQKQPDGAAVCAPASEPAARRSARRPVPRSKHDDDELPETGPRGGRPRSGAGEHGRAAGKLSRSHQKHTPTGSPAGSDIEPEGSQPQRKRFRQLVFSNDADGGPDTHSPPHAEDGPDRLATSPAVAAHAAASTPLSRKRPPGGSTAAGSIGKAGAGKRTHGPRKSHGIEDEEMLKSKGRGKRALPKAPVEPAPAPGERQGGVCRHTECEPAVQPVFAQLSHLLCARPRRWTMYEWFYPAIDLEFFKPAESEFQACLSEAGVGHVQRLTRQEWAFVRGLIGRPRRVSSTFLQEERQRLHEHRSRARRLGLAARLAVGQRVTAFHPKVRQLHLGAILTPDGESYRVQFDRAELGVQLVPDFHLIPQDAATAGSGGLGAGSAAGLAGALGVEAYAALREHHALIGMGVGSLGALEGLGGPSLAALRSLDALNAGAHGGAAGAAGSLLRGCGLGGGWPGGSAPFLPIGACGGLAQGWPSPCCGGVSGRLLPAILAAEAGLAGAASGGAGGEESPSAEHVQLARRLSALLQRKRLLVSELTQTNDEVEAGALPLDLSAEAGEEGAETAAIKQHYKWLLDELESTSAQVEALKPHVAEARAQLEAGTARRVSLERLSSLIEQCVPTAQSILADALQTTRAHEHSLPWSPGTPALSSSAQSVVLAAITLLLHVQASANAALSAEETLLLLESSLAGVQPKASSNTPVFREVTSALSAICGLLTSPTHGASDGRC